MAAKPEVLVKRKVCDILKAAGAYYFYPVASGYMSAGVPDIVACFKGRFIGIECKAGANKPTALQEQNLERISAAGGTSLVINEGNIHEVYRALGIEI